LFLLSFLRFHTSLRPLLPSLRRVHSLTVQYARRCCAEHIADVTCRRQMPTDLRCIMAVCRFRTKISFCYYRRKEI
jgi:hypothetical protein